jgi:hypothetical protein
LNIFIDTELEAVNQILSSIGESPVNSIENPTNVDVINAVKFLERVSRKFQSRGWIFNTNNSYTLNPDIYTSKITWNSLIIRLTGSKIYNKRGSYVYDFQNQTDIFTAPIVVQAVLLVDFEDLPETAKAYITARAALEFQAKYQGDDTVTQSLSGEVQEAWAHFQEYLLDVERPNMLQRPDVFGILGRT